MAEEIDVEEEDYEEWYRLRKISKTYWPFVVSCICNDQTTILFTNMCVFSYTRSPLSLKTICTVPCGYSSNVLPCKFDWEDTIWNNPIRNNHHLLAAFRRWTRAVPWSADGFKPIYKSRERFARARQSRTSNVSPKNGRKALTSDRLLCCNDWWRMHRQGRLDESFLVGTGWKRNPISDSVWRLRTRTAERRVARWSRRGW